MDPRTCELLSFALLNLDPRINDKRTVINSILIEIALYESKSHMVKQQIIDSIRNNINCNYDISEDEFIRSIEDCIVRKTIKIINNPDAYMLSEKRTEELNNSTDDFRRIEDLLFNNLVYQIEQELGHDLDDKLSRQIFQKFKYLLTEEIYKNAILIANETKKIEDLLFDVNSTLFLEPIDKIIEEYYSNGYELVKRKIKIGITEYIRKLPEELVFYLKSVLYNIFITQILNLDPSIKNIQLALISKRRIYLDTNIVLAFLCEGQPFHNIVSEVIGASRQLGVQLYISPITKEELINQVSKAKHNYQLQDRYPLIKRIAIQGDDAILATYIQKKHKNPRLNWLTFISRFEDIDDFLFNNEILVEDDLFEVAVKNQNLEKYRRAIKDFKPPWVSASVIEHDSVNCVLITKLQEKYPADEIGQVVWLITMDSSLSRSQKHLLSQKILNHPYCLSILNWGEIVLPISDIFEIKYDNFLGYLAESKFGVLTEKDIVQIGFFDMVLNSEFDIDALSKLPIEHTISAMKALQESREVLDIINKSTTMKSAEDKEKCKSDFQLKLAEVIEDTNPLNLIIDEKDEKIGQITSEMESLRLENNEFKKSIFYKIYLWFKNVFGKGNINISK